MGGLAYTPDISDVPAASMAALSGLDVWIIDALRDIPHPTHFNVDTALEWIARVRPRRAILTNLSADLDFEELRRRLPENVEPAFDGLIVKVVDR